MFFIYSYEPFYSYTRLFLHSLFMHCHSALCPQHPFFIIFIGLWQSGQSLFSFAIILLPRRIVLFALGLARGGSELLARQPSQSSATHLTHPTAGLRPDSVVLRSNLSQARSVYNPLARICRIILWERAIEAPPSPNAQDSSSSPIVQQ